MNRALFILAHDEARRRAIECVKNAPAGFRVTVQPPKRGRDINAALHAKLGEVAERVQWSGKTLSLEEWKRLFTAAWMRATNQHAEFLPAIDGHGIDIVFRRTSEMTQAEVRDLLAYIDAWCAERPEMQEEVES